MRVNLEARAAAAAQKRAETRERLLEAGFRLLADKGPEGVSVEDFATAAGVSRGTFYNYFPTVQDLVLALGARMASDVDRWIAPLRTEVSDPAARIAGMVHRLWIIFADDPLKGWVAARIESFGAPRQAIWDDEFAALYRRAVARGRFPPGDLAAARSVVFGAMRMAVRDLYMGEVGVDHATPMVAAMLRACGMEGAEADRISREQAAAARHAMPRPQAKSRDAGPAAAHN